MLSQRITYTKGMRASLVLLLRDARLPEEARALVEEHHANCEAIIKQLEALNK